ncbi:uncharacterized protein AFUA_2G01470 [Aspergillus fumigatus Af293]|uniref:Uncharacterized protein n=2 Tax=Aspergillus fumigatus TaxID=746128 RepID=Q4WIL0_ASPFU|nr:hypothetical protein AFUA_2G01470 [Aspergillus fumigatus Af293]EAL87245.1 hypothetical protein AFUA_2G01470 [Aspergillus fumigatus Af293]EDP53811.1 hypothetical protein AFUB_018550 [Aspergillus fumigatus A1163]
MYTVARIALTAGLPGKRIANSLAIILAKTGDKREAGPARRRDEIEYHRCREILTAAMSNWARTNDELEDNLTIDNYRTDCL